MLGKLLKYDLRLMMRLMIPLVLVLVVSFASTAILGSLNSFNIESFLGLGMGGGESPVLTGLFTASIATYVVALFASSVIVYIFIVMRFYTNLFSNEGYLSFTLPVKPMEQYWSKYISAVVSIAILGITIMLTINLLVVIFSDGELGISDLFEFYSTIMGTEYVVLLIISIILGIILEPIKLYMCMCIGQLYKNKIIASIVVYVIIYVVLQVISTVYTISTVFISGEFMETSTLAGSEMFFTGTILWITIVSTLVLSVAFYLVSRKILITRLNLE